MRFTARDLGIPAASILVVALAVGAGWSMAALEPDTRPDLTSALDVLPEDTTVVGFTGWSAIREHHSISQAARRDLSTRSAIENRVDQMDDLFGWSAADVRWEVIGQDPRGTAVIVRLDPSIRFDGVSDKLRAAGYRLDGSRWSGGRPADLPEIFTHLALVPRQRLIVLSDRSAPVSRVLDVVHGHARSLAANPAAAATAKALAGSDSVLLQGGTLACRTTAVPDAVREEAETAIARAGGLKPYRFSGRGVTDRGGSGFSAQQLVFAMTFESAVVASDQARVRARLAAGPFIGRSGPIEETLRLRSTAAEESTARLSFAHDPDTDVFMTGTGPVLFASCATPGS